MTKQSIKADRIPTSADIVIVGAGAAGLYCAYRLLQDKPKRQIVILDRLDRTGGRLDTDLVKIKDLDGQTIDVREEEGGMRFNSVACGSGSVACGTGPTYYNTSGRRLGAAGNVFSDQFERRVSSIILAKRTAARERSM